MISRTRRALALVEHGRSIRSAAAEAEVSRSAVQAAIRAGMPGGRYLVRVTLGEESGYLGSGRIKRLENASGYPHPSAALRALVAFRRTHPDAECEIIDSRRHKMR